MAEKAKKANSKLWVVGQDYLIRTVTMYYIGTLVGIDEHEIVLKDAAWVADTGRFAAALKSGKLSEVEPYPEGLVGIGRGALVDASVWEHGCLRSVI